MDVLGICTGQTWDSAMIVYSLNITRTYLLQAQTEEQLCRAVKRLHTSSAERELCEELEGVRLSTSSYAALQFQQCCRSRPVHPRRIWYLALLVEPLQSLLAMTAV